MLYITVEMEEVKDKISSVSDYFDAVYEPEWLNSQLAKDIIKGIDLSTHIKDNIIESPVLGGISPVQLSSGCKGCLLLLNEDDIIVSGERFGDNCFYWLGKIGKVKDIHITLHHYLRDYSIEMTACITNINKMIYNSKELCIELFRMSNIEGYDGVWD